MHLVHDGARGRPLQGGVTFPIIDVHIYDHALHRFRGIAASLPRGVATIALWNNDTPSVRIEEDFGWIEAHSTSRIERSLSPITVDLPCFCPRYKDMPVVIGPVGCRIHCDHTRRLSVINTIKKKEFNRC